MCIFKYRRFVGLIRVVSLALIFGFACTLNAIARPLSPVALQDNQTTEIESQSSQKVESASNSKVKEVGLENPGTSAKFDPERIFFSGAAPTSIEDLRELERKFAEITELVKPATVNIAIEGSQGSGVVVSADGYILTAAHVIGRPNGKATITFPDKKQYTATTLGVESRFDSGMLKIDEGQADEFPHIEMGLSSELKTGQWVLAIGHPGGLDEKRGLVVRAGRVLRSAKEVIQSDCSLVGGDSGGPLVDLNGEVIAIHSRIGMNLWDNLHVPVDVYSAKWDLMVQGVVLDGTPRLGFRVQKASLEIDQVKKREAADKAGLKVGDIIKKIDQNKLETNDDLKRVASGLRPYQKIKIIVLRGDEELTLEMTVGPTR